MALNVSTFKTRTLTSIVFVAVMAAGLFISHWSFFILFSVIHFGCWIEYQRMIGLIDPEYAQITPFHRYGVMIAGWCIMLYFTNDQYLFLGIRLHALGWWLGLLFMFLLPVIELLFAKNIRPRNIGLSALGLLYISLSLGLTIDLKNLHPPYYITNSPYPDLVPLRFHVIYLPLFVIACMWINDTLAYIIGSLIGKTPLSKISPKKTWEGTVGALVVTSLLVGFLANYYQPAYLGFSIAVWILLAFITSLSGVIGDLVESKLKRLAGVKDSGQLMPGHGGFLDRFDSFLLAVPIFWCCIQLLL